MNIIIVKQGITKLDVDCIVNAANENLYPGGGVCGAIFKEAGHNRLNNACHSIGHCNTGSAVITPGFDLKARYIIHAVGPKWQGGMAGEEKLLYRCYESAISLAEKNNCNTIAFPVISSGIYGYPKEAAWEVAIRAADKSNPYLKKYFAVIDDEMYELGKKVYYRVFNQFNREQFHEGMFDEYIREENPEYWKGFADIMWKLGFDMDAYNSAPAVRYNSKNNGDSNYGYQDAVLTELRKCPIRIVGNYIFSRFRYLTHWSMGWNHEEEHYFFEMAFPILENKMKDEILNGGRQ